MRGNTERVNRFLGGNERKIFKKGRYLMKKLTIVLFCIALAAAAYWPRAADAYETYSVNRDATNCRACHGDFRSSPYISPTGQNWGDDAHDVHRNGMLDGDCDTCHSAAALFPVSMSSSVGGLGFQAISCVGCHGREQDMGNDSVSLGRGAGLRQEHFNSGITECANCHTDSVPANYTPVGENVQPSYYFTPDANHPNKPTDACNPNGEENIAGSPEGVDNDGDLVYDVNDPDCQAAVCGNGIIEAGEQCDDGNTASGDCCSATCRFEAAGSLCPDGLFCNGEETCDGQGACQAGAPVDCGDGVNCTVDSCDEANDVCANTPDNANCPDDGLFCTGQEMCDPALDCVSTGDPCPAGTVCNETTDICEPVAACGNGVVDPGEQCDDGNTLNGDCCSSTCQFEPAGSSCADALFCNGAETCDGAGSCAAVSACPPSVDGCVIRNNSCDEANDVCVDLANDALCNDGLFCNGAETCDIVTGLCQAGTPVDCSDGVNCTVDSCDEANDVCANTPDNANCPDDGLFCTGQEICDPVQDCTSTGDPCPAGTVCNETTDICEPSAACGNGVVDAGEQCDDGNTLDGDCCSSTCVFEPAGSTCADALFCNGAETCDGQGLCQAGTAVDCSDGIGCTVDSCDEINDICVNTPNDNLCPDDGLFCTGQEICDTVQGCISTGDPCPAGTCNEDTNMCNVVSDKTAICHIPKGNPGNAHTITVDADAVADHLAHGDTLGPCDDD